MPRACRAAAVDPGWTHLLHATAAGGIEAGKISSVEMIHRHDAQLGCKRRVLQIGVAVHPRWNTERFGHTKHTPRFCFSLIFFQDCVWLGEMPAYGSVSAAPYAGEFRL